jgi:hypothetical protein
MSEQGFGFGRTGFGSVVTSMPSTTRSFGECLDLWLLPTSYPDDRKVPLAILTKNEHDTCFVERSHVLSQREAMLDLDTTKPFKLNAQTSGACESMLTRE